MQSLKLIFAIACCATTSAFAESDIPRIVIDGIKTYESAGGKEAATVWLRGSAFENDAGANSRVADILGGAETLYGKAHGFEPIKVIILAPSVRRVYMVILFDKGPVYACFECYNAQGTWIIPSMDLNTKADVILPPILLNGN